MRTCRACEINANDEQVKQMPMHTCGKDGPLERAEPKQNSGHSEGGEVPKLEEKLTKALEVARTLPCACSNCGMRETESAKKILEFAESLTATGSVAAPNWYSESQMYHWLIRENYSEQIAKELSAKWASDQQGAFNKGFEKGVRSVAAPASRNSVDKELNESIAELAAAKESIKELLPYVYSVLEREKDMGKTFLKGTYAEQIQAKMDRAKALLEH
jgi:hypothetical protein